MGKVQSDKQKKFEKSRNVAQLVYYLLAIFVFSIYIWFVIVLPNVDFSPSRMTNGTIPLPIPLP